MLPKFTCKQCCFCQFRSAETAVGSGNQTAGFWNSSRSLQNCGKLRTIRKELKIQLKRHCHATCSNKEGKGSGARCRDVQSNYSKREQGHRFHSRTLTPGNTVGRITVVTLKCLVARAWLGLQVIHAHSVACLWRRAACSRTALFRFLQHSVGFLTGLKPVWEKVHGLLVYVEKLHVDLWQDKWHSKKMRTETKQ